MAVEPGKIFVGGLSWKTTKETLKAHFEQFGEVSESVIMVDPQTHQPRGFGFVTFADVADVEKALATHSHKLDDKQVDPKHAAAKGNEPAVQANLRSKKIFIGGLHSDTTDDEVREYFSQFGPVTDVDLKYDKASGHGPPRMRGFGFVGFKSEDVVVKVLATQYHQIRNKRVEAKKAESKAATGGSGGGGRAPYPNGSPYYNNSYYGGGVVGGGVGGVGGDGGGYPGQQQQQHQQYNNYGGYGNHQYPSYGPYTQHQHQNTPGPGPPAPHLGYSQDPGPYPPVGRTAAAPGGGGGYTVGSESYAGGGQGNVHAYDPQTVAAYQQQQQQQPLQQQQQPLQQQQQPLQQQHLQQQQQSYGEPQAAANYSHGLNQQQGYY